MKKQKNLFVCLLLAVATACLAIPLLTPQNSNVSASSITPQTFAVGAGTANDPFTISNADELVAFSAEVNGGNSYSNEYVILSADINMSSYSNFTPIGQNSSTCFRGNFNGQGHTISNLTITGALGTNYIGLFGYIKASSNVVIQNFTIQNMNISGSSTSTIYGGAVVGFCELSKGTNFNNATISKIAVRGGEIKITGRGTTSSVYVGGIVGGTSISYNNQDMTPDYSFDYVLIIELSYSSTKVSFVAEGKYYSSGILGLGFANILNCYSLNNPLFCPNRIYPSSNTGLLFVKCSYYYYNMNANYIYWGAFTYKPSGTSIRASDVYSIFAVSANANANDWILESPDNTATDGQLIIKNVGNIYEEPVIQSADITVVERFYNIITNAYENIETTPQEISIGQVFIAETNTGMNRLYLTNIGKTYFDFINGPNTTSITNSSLTITSEHITFAINGYTLYVNYMNGFPVNINGAEYWLTSENNNIYTYNQTTNQFSVISALEDSNLIPTQTGLYFLGWATKSVGTCDYVNGVVDETYIDWHTDVALIIKAERANLQSSTDFTITSLTCDATNNAFNSESAITLYPVWGDLKFRCYTAVYKYVNGVYTQISNITVNSSAVKRENYLRLTSGENFNISLINSVNQQIALNYGYNEISWNIGTLGDEEDYTDAKYGTLSATNLATTTLQAPTFETAIFAVLIPRANIGITVQTNEFEGSENLVFKIKNIVNTNLTSMAITNDTDLIYGETYTITVEGIPDGWYIKNARIVSANTSFSIKTNTCTFTIDSNQDTLTVVLDIEESFFTDLIKYTFIGLGVISIATIFLSLMLNTFKPALSEKVISKSNKKK